MNTNQQTNKIVANMIDSVKEKRKRLGGKAANLRELENLGYTVPTFQVVSPQLIKSITNVRDEEALYELLNSYLEDKTVLDNLDKAIGVNALTETLYAVRSSGSEEDGELTSFAGQFESYLNIAKNDISKHVIKVWLSAYSEQIKVYKQIKSSNNAVTLPCVIIQEMVNADIAGVAFSADPISGNKETVLVNSVYGLANKLVEGKVNSASYTIAKGIMKSSHDEKLGRLSKWQLKKIYKEVKSIEKDFDAPQDIEWAFRGNKLFILQTRNITTIKSNKNKSKRVDIYDNSNIGESYPGITTPLTFSFARTAYKNVYLQFCHLMGVSNAAIEQNSEIFPQMLGYKKGRIYYNLLNWYRLLQLFPGYKSNKQFMEQMMGLSEKLEPGDLSSDAHKEKTLSLKERLFDRIELSKAICGLIIQFITLETNTRKFQKRLDNSLSQLPDNLNDLSAEELVNTYTNLEKALLTKWDAPIVNDFFAMIFYGVLKKLSSSWLKDDAIHNQLLCGESGIISTEPVGRLEKMAAIVRADKGLSDALANYEEGMSLKEFQINKNFYQELVEYLEKFGYRSCGELKLETKSLNEDPRSLISAIYALSKKNSVTNKDNTNQALAQRIKAEQKVKDTLKNKPIKQAIFALILKQARLRIKMRENLRFERTRVFGTVRKIFVQLGTILANNKVLEHQDDIFYLEVEEVIRHHCGTSTTVNLKKLVELRKEEQRSNFEEPAPPDRMRFVDGVLETQKQIVSFDSKKKSKQLLGIGCCPGIVKGKAKLVLDPQTESLDGYDILIAQRTDPGWITVISQAKAVVVEYGSLLSHTAIVARELGIPTIVATSGLIESIKTGDLLEIDGGEGTLSVLEKNIAPQSSKEVA